MYRPTTTLIESLSYGRVARAGEVLFFEEDRCDYVYELHEGIARDVSFTCRPRSITSMSSHRTEQ